MDEEVLGPHLALSVGQLSRLGIRIFLIPSQILQAHPKIHERGIDGFALI